jgi:tetratricopeptide (TPR) repeat protein
MRSTIAWSYDLLDHMEAVLFRRLAVFQGGCIFPTARKICGPENLDEQQFLKTLEGLVLKNLVYLEEGYDGHSRVGMFETIREYAGEKLEESGEGPEILARHALFITELAEKAEPFLTSGERDSWILKLEAEIDNIRAVLKRSLNRKIDPLFGIRTAGTLGWFWHLRGYLSEGRNWASSFVELPEASAPTRERAKVLFPAGGLAWSQGDYRTCDTLLTESASIFREIGDHWGLLNTQAILAGALASLRDYNRALRLCEELSTLMRKKHDRWGLAFVLLWYGDILITKNHDIGLARSMFEESHHLAEAVKDPWLHAEALNHLGVAAGMQGDFENACSFFDESLRYHESTGDRWAVARGLSGYADVLIGRSKFGEARERLHGSLHIWMEMGNRRGLMACISALAQIAAAEGLHTRAATLRGSVAEPVQIVGYLFSPRNLIEYDASFNSVRKDLGEASWTKKCQHGRTMTMEQVFAYVMNDSDDIGISRE